VILPSLDAASPVRVFEEVWSHFARGMEATSMIPHMR
jgi:hypothetical protein